MSLIKGYTFNPYNCTVVQPQAKLKAVLMVQDQKWPLTSSHHLFRDYLNDQCAPRFRNSTRCLLHQRNFFIPLCLTMWACSPQTLPKGKILISYSFPIILNRLVSLSLSPELLPVMTTGSVSVLYACYHWHQVCPVSKSLTPITQSEDHQKRK